MKKKLSLAVAGLMALTLAPVNTFALKADYSSVASVEDNEGEKGTVTFRADFEIQDTDVNLKDEGVISVRLLGDDVEFKDDKINVKLGDNDANPANVNVSGNYAVISEVKKADIEKKHIVITATAQFDGAKDGEYEVEYDLTGIGLNKIVKRYAKLTKNDGDYTKSLESKKTVGRGEATGARFEVKGKKGDTITLRLPSDYAWEKSDVFGGKDFAITKDKDDREATFELTSTRAVVTPKFTVAKGASKGDVDVDVKKNKEDSETVTIAEYVDYNVTMELKKAVKEVLANGSSQDVEVVVKATDKTPLPRYIDFELDGGEAKIKGDITSDKAVDEFSYENTAGKKDIKFTLNITPDWDKDGDITLKATGRGMDELSLVVLKVQPVAKMTVEQKEVLGGDAKVAVNDIVIKETKAGAFKAGQVYGVTLEGLKFNDVKFDAKGKVEADGVRVKDLKLDKKDTTIYFTVDTKSKKDAPATITLKDVQVVSNRALPFGTHKLTFVKVADEATKAKDVKRGAMYLYTKDDDFELFEINKADFIKVVDKVSKVKKTTIFTLGSADYTVEGAAMKLDTPVFTQDNYTMLPVRAIADALGVEVVWNQENLTATFIDGDIVVSVTENAKVLYKNGNQYPMTTKATVKANRMFIPVSSVGDAFGLTRDYDYTYSPATKQVTIYPKKEAVKTEEVKKDEAKKDEAKKDEAKKEATK